MLIPLYYHHNFNIKELTYLNTTKELNLLSIQSAMQITHRTLFVFLDCLTNTELLPLITTMKHFELRKVLIRRVKFNRNFETNPLYYKLENDNHLFKINRLEELLDINYFNVVLYIIDFCYDYTLRLKKKGCLFGFDEFDELLSYFNVIIKHQEFRSLGMDRVLKLLKVSADHIQLTDLVLTHPYFKTL